LAGNSVGNKVGEKGGRTEKKEDIKAKMEKYKEKLRNKLLTAEKDLRIRTPVKANGGAIFIVKYTTKNGNTRTGLRFEPSGTFRNAMTLNSEEHIEFFNAIVKNAEILRELLKVVVEVNEELKTLETVESLDFDELLIEE